MRALPRQRHRRGLRARPPQRDAVVAGDRETQALRREGEPADGAVVIEGALAAVGWRARSPACRRRRRPRPADRRRHESIHLRGRSASISLLPSPSVSATRPSSPPVRSLPSPVTTAERIAPSCTATVSASAPRTRRTRAVAQREHRGIAEEGGFDHERAEGKILDRGHRTSCVSENKGAALKAAPEI